MSAASPEQTASAAGMGRQFKHRAAPILVWIVCVAGLGIVSQQRAQYIEGTGLAQSAMTTIAPALDGTIASVGVELFAEIEAGQIVAVMNDAIIQAEFQVAGAELKRLSASLTAERLRVESELKIRELDALNDLRRFEMNEEEARVRYLEMLVEQESNLVEVERLRIQAERYRSMVEQQLSAPDLYDEARLQYEALKKQVEENDTAIAAAKRLLDQSIVRRNDRSGQTGAVDIENILAPIRSEIDVQQARIEEIQQRRQHLILRSPIAGRVTQVLRGTGETVLAGDPVMVVAESESHRVVAYLKESSIEHVAAGSEVLVRSHSRPGVTARARVARMGAMVEDMPIAAQSIPLFTQRGYPVLIDSIAPGTFFPGERVNVRIRAGAPAAVEASTPGTI